MNQPPSPLRWFLLPLGSIYIIALIVLLFKFNPELMAQKSLLSKMSSQKSEAPLVIPDTSTISSVAIDLPYPEGIFRQGYERVNIAPKELKMRHQMLRAKVFEFENLDENHRPQWVRDTSGTYATMGPKNLTAFNKELEKQWEFKIIGDKNSFVTPPVLSRHKLFIGTTEGKLYALGKDNGHIHWVLPLDTTLYLPATYYKSNLFLAAAAPDGNHFHILKIKGATGEILWRSDKLEQKPSSRTALHQETGTLYFALETGALVAMSTDTGKVKWRFEESPTPMHGAPTIIEDRIFVSNDEGLAYGIELKNGKKAWEYQLKSGTDSSFTRMPTTDWIAIITNSGYLHVIDRKTGEGRWRHRTYNKKAHKSIAAMRLNAESITELELLWRYKGWVLLAPCRDTYLCFFNPKEGRVIHRLKLRGTLASDLIFDKEDRSFVAMVESGTGPVTFFEKSDENIKLPKWAMGYFLQLKDFRRRAKAMREEALTPKPEVTAQPASVLPTPKTEPQEPDSKEE